MKVCPPPKVKHMHQRMLNGPVLMKSTPGVNRKMTAGKVSTKTKPKSY